MTERKQLALKDLPAAARRPVLAGGFEPCQKGLLELSDPDLPRDPPPRRGVSGRAVAGKAPWDMRLAQAELLAAASQAVGRDAALLAGMAEDVAACLDRQPTKEQIAATWPDPGVVEWLIPGSDLPTRPVGVLGTGEAGAGEPACQPNPGAPGMAGRFVDVGSYAEYYEQWDLAWLAVHSAGIIAACLYARQAVHLSKDAEPIVRALARCCEHHDFGDPRGSTCRHVGAIIDCWSQATGIEIVNPTGVWVIRSDAARPVRQGGLGWRKPRRTRAINRGAPRGRTGLA